MTTLGMIGGTYWYATEDHYRTNNEGVTTVAGVTSSPLISLSF